MKKHKKPYIDSRLNQISLADAFLRNKQLQEKIDQLVQEKLHLFGQEIKSVVEQHHDPKLPISIFKSESSTLEIIVKYLHELEQRSFADIAALLQRDDRTIWHAYRRSVRRKVQLLVDKSGITVPVSLFAQRQFSPLEVLVSYLHEQHQLSFAEIARLLSLSPKTVWTVYHRKQLKQKRNVSR